MNEALKRLYEDDRREHSNVPPMESPDYAALRQRDRDRREQAARMIAAGELHDADDFYHAAQLFQHGDVPEDAWQAHQLALEAAKRGSKPARWLAAAAYDRWLMSDGKPQKYGTQYVTDGKRHRLWDVDPATTDEDRAAWDVPPLAEQLRKAEEATRRDPPKPLPLDGAPKWYTDALKRWQAETDEEPASGER